MNYQEIVDFLNEVPKFTKKNKPGNTLELMRRLGDPQEKTPVIHVAGTNGKGSVCAFLESALRRSGKKTGLFISPHLVTINERFQISRCNCSDEEFVAAWNRVEQAVKEMMADGFNHPTYFELLFAIGMVIFDRAGVDVIVMETGLGGRMDATNVVKHPACCVITSISLDHTEYLGETVPEIAGEKAGIIKEGVPVVFDATIAEAAPVILAKAEQMHAPAYGLTMDSISDLERSDSGISYQLEQNGEKIPMRVPYAADYQVRNSALAAKAASILGVSTEVISEAIASTVWEGRMEQVLPGVILDGAHNEDGIREWIRTVQQVQKNSKIILLFSAVVEKNYEKMIAEIVEGTNFEEIIVTQISGYRQVKATELGGLFRKYAKVPITEKDSIAEAFAYAREIKGERTLFCSGSLYLVGELKSILAQEKDL